MNLANTRACMKTYRKQEDFHIIEEVVFEDTEGDDVLLQKCIMA